MKIIHKPMFFFFMLLVTGCAKEKPSPPSYPVKITEVMQEDIPIYVKGVGTLSASIGVNIIPQVEGILTNIFFQDGELVHEGDLLMTIDSSLYAPAVREAEASLAVDKAKLLYAIDFADTYGKLVGEEYVSRLDYAQGIQNVDVYKAAIESDLANLSRAKTYLGYTEIRSPIEGYVGLRRDDPGNHVSPHDLEPLVVIRKVSPLSLAFSVPDQYLCEIREAYKKGPLYLEAELVDNPSHPLTGYLNFIDNTVNKQTGMVKLQGSLPNEDERGWPGQFVRVSLKLKTLPNATVVHKNAFVLGETGFFVFVLNEETMTVDMRMAKKGIEYRGFYVVDFGLEPHEKVVIDGQQNLYQGAHVYLPEEEKDR